MMEHGGLLVLIVLSSLAPFVLVTAATDDLPLSAKLLRMTHDDQQSTRCASLNVCRLLLSVVRHCVVSNLYRFTAIADQLSLTQAKLRLLPSAGREMSTGQSAVMLCGCEVKAGWLIPLVDKRVGGR